MSYPAEIPLFILDVNNVRFITGVFLSYTLHQERIGCSDEIRLLAEKNFRRLYKTMPEELKKSTMAEIETYKKNEKKQLRVILESLIDALKNELEDL